MFKIIKYVLKDLFRAHWLYVYCGFFGVLCLGLMFLTTDLSKAVLNLMNVLLLLTPLMGIVFGMIYFFNAREYSALFLSMPLRRHYLFWGQYLGVSMALSACILIGMGLPLFLFVITNTAAIGSFLLLAGLGILLSFIFTAWALLLSLSLENRVKGFGYGILLWLFFALIYDTVLLLVFLSFSDYPLQGFALGATLLNPIDLARILLLMTLDIQALMGYTGAVFKQFFGQPMGVMIAFGMLFFWIGIPLLWSHKRLNRKDF
ncbi:MAG: ABC transporter permease [Flavobacteriaceae bacterium]